MQEVKNETTGEMVNVTVNRPMPMPTAMRESPEYRDAYAVHGQFSAKPTKSRTLNYATNGLDVTRKGCVERVRKATTDSISARKKL